MFRTKFVEETKTHILGSIIFFFRKLYLYEVMWKNTVERGRSHMTIQRMRIAFWIPKATNTQSEYVIPIAFQLQQLLRANAPRCYVIRIH